VRPPVPASRPRAPGGLRTAALLGAAALAGCGLLPPRSAELEIVGPDSGGRFACHAIPGLPGTEDIVVDQRSSLAYLSSLDRRAIAGRRAPAARDGHVGHLFRLDLKQARPAPVDVTPVSLRADHGFAPHGLSLLPGPDGTALLFVINHRRRLGPDAHPDAAKPIHSIEVVELPDGTDQPWLVRRTIHDPSLTSPNDIAAVGEDEFYVTNEQGAGGALWTALAALFGLNGGSVVHFKGSRPSQPVLPLPLANGIAVDPGAALMHVVTSGDGVPRSFRWQTGHPATARAPLRAVPLGSRADNIDVDPGTGDLIVAAHSSVPRLIAHALGRERAPSPIIEIRRGTGGLPEGRPTEILVSDGDESRPSGIAAASVAAVYRPPGGGRRLIVGAIVSDRILVCDEKPQAALGGTASAQARRQGETP